MKKVFFISALIGSLSFLLLGTNHLLAQELTVPDYSYGTVYSEYGSVTQDGVTSPGPYGGYSTGEDERVSGVFLAHGYRWWGYPSYVFLQCGYFPPFNFPGSHGVWDMSDLGCSNGPIGFMGSWGAVVADPSTRKISAIVLAENDNDPTAPYCIPNPFGSGQICYPAPSTWGYGSSYGYLRKVVVVQSTGVLQEGDPVDIRASLASEGVHEGDGVATSTGVLFLNKFSDTPWHYEWSTREYLSWGDIEDILGTPDFKNNMLGNLVVDLNISDDTTATVAIGDTIVVEVGYNNTIKHLTQDGLDEASGSEGEFPLTLINVLNYIRNDSVKSIIKRLGNDLTYDLICLTPGAILSPLAPKGPNLDQDNDGIIDALEKGPNGNDNNYDGNADGTPDYQQANVASFLTYDGQNYVTMVFPSGTELSQLTVTGNPSPSDTPEDAVFPFGFFDFTIDGIDPGEAVTIMLILHDGETIENYYKYGLTPDNTIPHWYEFNFDGQTGAEINGNVITLHFVDGLRGDEDITANGTVKEPGGPSKTTVTGLLSLRETSKIKVFPNPACDQIAVEIPDGLFSSSQIRMGIIDLSGRYVMIDNNFEISGNPRTIFLNSLNDGIYLLEFSDNHNIYRVKIIKMK